MAKGDLLGYIDCPHCGLKDGMRVTEDKNGQPFGFCDAECDGQLRVGGKERRVSKFYAKHPHLKKQGASSSGEPAPVNPVAPVVVHVAKVEKPKRAPVATLLG